MLLLLLKNVLNIPIIFFCSGFDWPMEPSEIFKAIESQALQICEAKLNFSLSGKVEESLSITSPKSMAFCQIRSFSNLNFSIFLILFSFPIEVVNLYQGRTSVICYLSPVFCQISLTPFRVIPETCTSKSIPIFL